MLMNPLFVQNLLVSYAWLGGFGVCFLVLAVLLLAVFAYASVLSVQLWNLGNLPVPSPRTER